MFVVCCCEERKKKTSDPVIDLQTDIGCHGVSGERFGGHVKQKLPFLEKVRN